MYNTKQIDNVFRYKIPRDKIVLINNLYKNKYDNISDKEAINIWNNILNKYHFIYIQVIDDLLFIKYQSKLQVNPFEYFGLELI